MTDDQRDEMLVDMHGKVTLMYGVLFDNGLIAKVEKHEEAIKNGHLTCPIGKEITDHIKTGENKKYLVPVWVVILMGALALIAPFAERVIK